MTFVCMSFFLFLEQCWLFKNEFKNILFCPILKIYLFVFICSLYQFLENVINIIFTLLTPTTSISTLPFLFLPNVVFFYPLSQDKFVLPKYLGCMPFYWSMVDLQGGYTFRGNGSFLTQQLRVDSCDRTDLGGGCNLVPCSLFQTALSCTDLVYSVTNSGFYVQLPSCVQETVSFQLSAAFGSYTPPVPSSTMISEHLEERVQDTCSMQGWIFYNLLLSDQLWSLLITYTANISFSYEG